MPSPQSGHDRGCCMMKIVEQGGASEEHVWEAGKATGCPRIRPAPCTPTWKQVTKWWSSSSKKRS